MYGTTLKAEAGGYRPWMAKLFRAAVSCNRAHSSLLMLPVLNRPGSYAGTEARASTEPSLGSMTTAAARTGSLPSRRDSDIPS